MYYGLMYHLNTCVRDLGGAVRELGAHGAHGTLVALGAHGVLRALGELGALVART